MSSTRLSGPRFVLALYVVLVCATAIGGFLIGAFVEELRPPAFLFLIEFPATPIGMAAYGGLTIAVVLGVPILAIAYVSRRLDETDERDTVEPPSGSRKE